MDLFNIKMHIVHDLHEGRLAEPIEFLDKIFNEASFEFFLVEVLLIALIIAFINSIIAFCVCKKKLNGFIVFIINIITKFSTILLIRFLFQIFYINKYLSESCMLNDNSTRMFLIAIYGCFIIVMLFILDMIIEGALYRRLFIKGEKDGWEISKICNAIANVIILLFPIIVNYRIQSIVHPKNRVAFVSNKASVQNFYFKDALIDMLTSMVLVILFSFFTSIIAMLFGMKKKDICSIAIITLIVNTFVEACYLMLNADIEISKILFKVYANVGEIIYLGLVLASVGFCTIIIETSCCKKIIENNKNRLPIIFALSYILGFIIFR